MKQLLNVVAILCLSLFFVHTESHAADPLKVTSPNISNSTLKKLPTVAPVKVGKSGPKEKNEIKQPICIAIGTAEIIRNENGRWRWTVTVVPKINEQISANTAKIKVWHNAGGKVILIDSRVYDRPINPNYGYFTDEFYPSSESDTLLFELIQVSTDAGKTTLSRDKETVVDRTTVTIPPFGITMQKAGYSYNPKPEYLYAYLSNNSQWPIRVKVVMRGGNYGEWASTILGEQIITLKGGEENVKVKKEWAFTEKGGGYCRITSEIQLLDPVSGKVGWSEILGKNDTLPTF